MTPEVEAELDDSARANLSVSDQSRYSAYKAEVRNDPDAEAILRGFIWDASEECE